MTKMEKVQQFISNPAINHSWLAEKIYGDRGNASRKKLSVKSSGVQNWLDWEIEAILKIIKELKREL